MQVSSPTNPVAWSVADGVDVSDGASGVADGAVAVALPVGARPAASPMPTAQAIASAVTSVRAGNPSLRSLMIVMPRECCQKSGVAPDLDSRGCKHGARIGR